MKWLRKEFMQWVIAIVLVLAGVVVWRLGTSQVRAVEIDGDPTIQSECP